MSTATLRANQLRLYLSSLAYVLLHALRRLALAGTAWARAQVNTIRLRLLKIAAEVRLSARRIWLRYPRAYPGLFVNTHLTDDSHESKRSKDSVGASAIRQGRRLNLPSQCHMPLGRFRTWLRRIQRRNVLHERASSGLAGQSSERQRHFAEGREKRGRGRQMDHHAAYAMPQPLGTALDHAGRQRRAQAIEFFGVDGILEARQRGLRGRILARHRIATQQKLVNRIAAQAGGVVGVGIAAGDGEHALRQQLFQRVIDLARLPLVPQTGGQTGDQSVAPVGRLQQQRRRRNCPAAGQTEPPRAWEKCRGTTNTVSCYRHSRGSLLSRCKHCLYNLLVAQEAFRTFSLVNYPG